MGRLERMGVTCVVIFALIALCIILTMRDGKPRPPVAKQSRYVDVCMRASLYKTCLEAAKGKDLHIYAWLDLITRCENTAQRLSIKPKQTSGIIDQACVGEDI